VRSSKNTINVPYADKLFGPNDLDTKTSSDPNSSAFDNFLSQHRLVIAEEHVGKVREVKELEGPPREQATSRFARFFSHSTEEGISDIDGVERYPMASQVASKSNDVPKHGAPISFETLFQSQKTTTNNAAPSRSPSVTAIDGRRMLSEAEVLQSLGDKPHPNPRDFDDSGADDVMGFHKILAALAKGNVSSYIKFFLDILKSQVFCICEAINLKAKSLIDKLFIDGNGFTTAAPKFSGITIYSPTIVLSIWINSPRSPLQ
jgi:hypothetical protein